jgi:hypothetical protein
MGRPQGVAILIRLTLGKLSNIQKESSKRIA